MKEQCSELFERVFRRGGGHSVVECACGRTLFNPSEDWDWEEGELEELLENRELHPGKYRTMDHPIGTMEINGKVIATGCECDCARSYEAFLIDDSQRIAEYLNRRAQGLREQAEKITVKRRRMECLKRL